MATPAGGGAALCGPLLDYKTEKFALTRNRRVGLLHRLLQLAVLGYVLGYGRPAAPLYSAAPRPRAGLTAPPVRRWVFVVRRGYQDTDAAPRVSVVTKLKGVSVSRPEDARRRLWDAADFSRPPQVGEPGFEPGTLRRRDSNPRPNHATSSSPGCSPPVKLPCSAAQKEVGSSKARPAVVQCSRCLLASQGENVLFLVTNFIVTDRQVQGTCPEVSRPCCKWGCTGRVERGGLQWWCGMAELPGAVGTMPELREHWDVAHEGR